MEQMPMMSHSIGGKLLLDFQVVVVLVIQAINEQYVDDDILKLFAQLKAPNPKLAYIVAFVFCV